MQLARFPRRRYTLGFTPLEPALFVYTGGAPALYAYQDVLRG